jgi:hypothetical protein
LEELPLIRGAFADGRLSYSQVRALTRVERVVCERELLDLARHATAAQLERLLRAYRGVVARARADAGGGPGRWVRWGHADDGSLLLSARLPAEQGAVVLAALEAVVAADGSAHARDASAETPATAAGASAKAPATDIAAPASAGALATAAGASAEAPQTDTDASAETPATTTDASVEARASAVDASAEAPTPAERRADALVALAEGALAGRAGAAGADGDRFQVVVHVDTGALAGGDGAAELADGTAIGAQTARRLACDAAIVALLERAGRPLSVGRKTRSVPAALRRALASRDRGCRFPGCTSQTTLDAHHIKHWANGGPTSIENLVQLCRHHHRLLHEGGYSVTGHAGRLVFRRPDGRELKPVPRRRGCTRTITQSNRRAGRHIDPEATVGHSTGEPLDLAHNLDALLTYAPPEAPGI